MSRSCLTKFPDIPPPGGNISWASTPCFPPGVWTDAAWCWTMSPLLSAAVRCWPSWAVLVCGIPPLVTVPIFWLRFLFCIIPFICFFHVLLINENYDISDLTDINISGQNPFLQDAIVSLWLFIKLLQPCALHNYRRTWTINLGKAYNNPECNISDKNSNYTVNYLTVLQFIQFYFGQSQQELHFQAKTLKKRVKYHFISKYFSYLCAYRKRKDVTARRDGMPEQDRGSNRRSVAEWRAPHIRHAQRLRCLRSARWPSDGHADRQGDADVRRAAQTAENIQQGGNQSEGECHSCSCFIQH